MTIDPANFEPQGKPTREQARTVWDSMPNPSSRHVAEELVNRGFDISWRTIARWKANAWTEQTGRPVSEQAKARVMEVKKAATKELSRRPGAPPPTLTLDEYALIAKRRAELMLMSEGELDVAEARARKIMNIILAEQAAQRAHVMVLIPKDTGSLVGALAEAQRVGMAGGAGQVPGANDARVINGALTHIPDHPLASAIDKFLADQEVA